jgi:hypothetical protein
MPRNRHTSSERPRRPLLTFDAHFVPGGSFQVFLWAEHQSRSRIRFEIGSDVLSDVLGGTHPVHDTENVALCQSQRVRIIAACSNALRHSARNEIRLTPRDFD